MMLGKTRKFQSSRREKNNGFPRPSRPNRSKNFSGKGISETYWLFGIHAVRAALLNPDRKILRFVATRNAADRLSDAIDISGSTPEISDPRKFSAALDPGSVHQGAAIEVQPLNWGKIEILCEPSRPCSKVVLLDRITDPHNVGAILRTSEAFGALAAIAPRRHSAPESGGLAKSASGALERVPYLRVGNLAAAMTELQDMEYFLVGLSDAAPTALGDALAKLSESTPVGLVFGAEGRGLRTRTSQCCNGLARIETSEEFGTLNVSNAVAIALYAAATRNFARCQEII